MAKEKKFRDFPLTIRMSQNLGARLQRAADAMECDMGAFVRGQWPRQKARTNCCDSVPAL
jgi:hypothetical protein